MSIAITGRVRNVLLIAQNHAGEGNAVASRHLLSAMLQEGAGGAARVLRDLNVTAQCPADQRFDVPALLTLDLARRWAASCDHSALMTEHILLALLATPESAAARGIEQLGRSRADVRDLVLSEMGAGARFTPGRPSEAPYERAPIVRELREALRARMHVALVGPAGVGKTSIVHAAGFRDYWCDAELETPFLPQPTLDLSVVMEAHGSAVLEFVDGFDAFRRAIPEYAEGLHRIDVGAPDEIECTRILSDLLARETTPIRIRAEDLSSANELAASRIRYPRAPWSTREALRKAVLIERRRSVPELDSIVDQVLRLEREKDDAITMREFERAAHLRDLAMRLKPRRDALSANYPRPTSRSPWNPCASRSIAWSPTTT